MKKVAKKRSSVKARDAALYGRVMTERDEARRLAKGMEASASHWRQLYYETQHECEQLKAACGLRARLKKLLSAIVAWGER